MFGRNGRKRILMIWLAALVAPLHWNAAAFAASTLHATAAVSAGDVVVWDAAADYGVKTTAVEGAQEVAGVAAESVAAGNDCVIRQDGGRVAVNVIGTVSRGQWLITSATAGKAKGVDAPQAGMFARAVTGSGVPAPGQCYATVDLGFGGFESGLAHDHAGLSNLNWSAAGHTFDASLNIGAQNFESSGQFTDGSNGLTAAQGKAAYDHSVMTQNAHGLTYSGEGAGGGLDADTVDGSHAAAFAASLHAHSEADITDLEHDAQKIKGKPLDDAGLADAKIWKYEAATQTWKIGDDAGASSGAPTGATYITQTHDATLSAEQALGDLATGLLKNTTGTGVLSIAAAGTDYSAPGHSHAAAEVTDFDAEVSNNGDVAANTAHRSLTADFHGMSLTGEGAGGGLDADTVDGEHASAFADSTHTHGAADITPAGPDKAIQYNNGGALAGIAIGSAGQLLSVNSSGTGYSYTDPLTSLNRVQFKTHFLGTALPDEVTLVTSGTGAAGAFQNTAGGVYRLSCGTTDDGYAALFIGSGSILQFSPAKNAVMEIRLQSVTEANWGQISVGFVAGADPYAIVQKATFNGQYSLYSGNWRCSSYDGSDSESTESTSSRAAMRVLRIELSSSSVVFKIDGTTVATHSTAVPTASMLVLVHIKQVADSGQVTNTLDVDGWSVEQDI